MEPTTFEGPMALLRSSWNFFKTSWKTLSLIILLPIACLTAGPLFGIGGLGFVGALLEIVGVILAIAMQVAVIDAVNRISTGGGSEVTFSGQYRRGFSMFWSVVLLAIMKALIILGSTALFVIPGIFVAISTGFYLYIRVLDGHKGFAAFAESYRLVRGRWWGTFGRLLMLVLVYIVIGFAASIIAAVLAAIVGAHSAVGVAISLLVHVAFTVAMGTFASIYLYKVYSSLKASVSQASEDTKTFKGWLIAFLIIGIVALVLIPVFFAVAFIALLQKGILHSSTMNIPFHGLTAGSTTEPINY